MDDNEIVEMYFERNEDAIRETDKKYGRYCFKISNQILHNRSDSKECINDAYLKVWNSIPPARPSHLKLFIAKIVRNTSLNKLEMISAKKRGNNENHLILDELSECITTNDNSNRIVDDIVIRDLLNAFLSSLSKETRVIFVKRYWYMYSIKEIAKMYSMSESNAAVILYRTRNKLKELLEKEGILL